MNPDDLRKAIRTELLLIGLYSADAEELLMATCAQESLLGQYRHQVSGPALGIFQMEPGDHDDIWKNYLTYHTDLARFIVGDPVIKPDASRLQTDDAYAIAMCRVHYARCPRAFPKATDLNGLWMYYKVNYNSVHGAATQEQFNRHYQTLVHGVAR
jgi:hypothetical protein